MASSGDVFNCSTLSLHEITTANLPHDFNLTAFAEECPSFCKTAYGVGNPDLAGIGVSLPAHDTRSYQPERQLWNTGADRDHQVYVSYNIQAGIPFLFAFLPEILYRKYRGLTATRWHDSLFRLQKAAVDGQIIFTLPILVASYVRLLQSPPLYEYQFIAGLATAATSSAFASASTLVKLATLFPDKIRQKRLWLVVLELVLIMAFWITTLATVVRFTMLIYHTTKVCMPYGKTFVDLGRVMNAVAPGKSQGLYVYVPWILVALMVIPALGVLVLVSIGAILATRQRELLPTKREREGPLITSIMCREDMSLLAGVVCWLIQVGCVVALGVTRSGFRHMLAGDYYSENEWGFGQVIALFVWGPLLVEIFHYVGVTLFLRQ
jgi:hypothetical protein